MKNNFRIFFLLSVAGFVNQLIKNFWPNVHVCEIEKHIFLRFCLGYF